MKKINILLSLLVCFLTISGTGLITNYDLGKSHVDKMMPFSIKRKAAYTVSFLFTNDLPNGLSYLFYNGTANVGGTVGAGSYAYINLPNGTYTVNIGPTNGGGNPVPANFVFNNGVQSDGTPGHNFSGVSIGTGSGEASAFTATKY